MLARAVSSGKSQGTPDAETSRNQPLRSRVVHEFDVRLAGFRGWQPAMNGQQVVKESLQHPWTCC